MKQIINEKKVQHRNSKIRLRVRKHMESYGFHMVQKGTLP